jgi:hypothetical protein
VHHRFSVTFSPLTLVFFFNNRRKTRPLSRSFKRNDPTKARWMHVEDQEWLEECLEECRRVTRRVARRVSGTAADMLLDMSLQYRRS